MIILLVIYHKNINRAINSQKNSLLKTAVKSTRKKFFLRLEQNRLQKPIRNNPGKEIAKM